MASRVQRVFLVVGVVTVFLALTGCIPIGKREPAPKPKPLIITKSYVVPCGSQVKVDLAPGNIKEITVERTDKGGTCALDVSLSDGILIKSGGRSRKLKYNEEAEVNTTKVVFPHKASQPDVLGKGGVTVPSPSDPGKLEHFLKLDCTGSITGTCEFTISIIYESFEHGGKTYVLVPNGITIVGTVSKKECHQFSGDNPPRNASPNYTSPKTVAGTYALAVIPTGDCPVEVRAALPTAPANSFGMKLHKRFQNITSANPRVLVMNRWKDFKLMVFCHGTDKEGCGFDVKMIPLTEKP